MRKRNGASLLNVMVFMVFAVMVTAQVFFFSQSSMESLADEREIMMYRLNLDSLLEEAKTALEVKGEDNEIVHDEELDKSDNKLKYSQFLNGRIITQSNGKQHEVTTKAKFKDDTKWAMSSEWDSNKYYAAIHDLDYVFDSEFNSRTDWSENYSGSNMHKKVFAAMSPETEPIIGEYEKDGITPKTQVTERYYLIRVYAQLPSRFYDRKLMYQVLIKRKNESDSALKHDLDTLSFQEVWF